MYPTVIEVRKFHKNDLDLINVWLKDRKIKPIDLYELPEVGLVAVSEKDFIAAGFIRLGEGIGIIDSLVSNPKCSPEDRDMALNLIFEGLVKAAQGYKYEKLIGFSVDDNTLKRAEMFGFNKSNHTLMVREL